MLPLFGIHAPNAPKCTRTGRRPQGARWQSELVSGIHGSQGPTAVQSHCGGSCQDAGNGTAAGNGHVSRLCPFQVSLGLLPYWYLPNYRKLHNVEPATWSSPPLSISISSESAHQFIKSEPFGAAPLLSSNSLPTTQINPPLLNIADFNCGRRGLEDLSRTKTSKMNTVCPSYQSRK